MKNTRTLKTTSLAERFISKVPKTGWPILLRLSPAVISLLVVGLLFGCAPEIDEPVKVNKTSKRPNIVVILTDDLDAGSVSRMPNLRKLLIEEGATFENAFVTDSMCCPSRAAILRGQYTHNHKVFTNEPPHGAAKKFRSSGREKSTVVTWLHDEGYHTAFVGKYLNGYGFGKRDTTRVPPGWDEWYGVAGNYMSHRLSENGTVKRYDPRQRHFTDLLADKGTGYISRRAESEAPFFMMLNTKAPHQPATPAPRHRDAFADVPLPRPLSFNEADVSDKPLWVRNNPRLSPRQISYMEKLYRDRLRSMLSVDYMIGEVVRELQRTGELENTYIIFTSDNGFHLGQHRLEVGKWTAYEEDIRVPLVVRGPGVPADRVLDHMVLNSDLAPTLADLGEAEEPPFVDGRSFRPLLASRPVAEEDWRQSFLVESFPESVRKRRLAAFSEYSSLKRMLTGDPVPENWRQISTTGEAMRVGWGRPGFRAVRTDKHLYVEYDTGERELYDLEADPYQMNNEYPTAELDLLRHLQRRLEALTGCSGESCRAAEGGV